MDLYPTQDLQYHSFAKIDCPYLRNGLHWETTLVELGLLHALQENTTIATKFNEEN